MGGAYAFHSITAPFVPLVSTGLLELVTSVAGDATLLLDAVTIVPRNSGEIVLQNPSFDAAARVTVWPGYLGATPLAGWTVTGGAGLNLDGVGPFTDNGDAPDQAMVLFIQNAGTISQTLNGLTPGATYTLAYALNARNCCAGGGTGYAVTYGATTLMSEEILPVGSGPYHQRYKDFTAPSASGALTFTGTATTDHSLLLDNIRVIPGNADPGNIPVPLSSTVFARNAMRLAWPAIAPAGMRLQWSLTMLPGSWLDVTQPAVIEGADYTIYEPMDDMRRFYQLLKP